MCGGRALPYHALSPWQLQNVQSRAADLPPVAVTTDQERVRTEPNTSGRAVAIACGTYLALIVIATLYPAAIGWGIHAPAFLSAPARLLVFGLFVAGGALVAKGITRGERAGPSIRNRTDKPRATTFPRWFPWILAPVTFAMFWVLRTRTYFLGDQALWIDRIREGTKVTYSEPLSAGAWLGFRELLRALGIDIGPDTLAILPSLCGGTAVLLCWGIGSELSQKGRPEWLAGILLLAGVSQLYFGYIETYPIVSIAILSFLWLGLRFLNSRASILGPGLALGLAVGTHLAAAFLLPSYLLLLRRPMRPAVRLLAIVLPTALIGAILFLFAFGPEQVVRPIHLIWSALRVAAVSQPQGGVVSTFVRVSLDFWNLLLLTAAVPVMLLAVQLLSRRRHDVGDALQSFLTVASISGAAIAWTLSWPGTPAQDWDLLALFSLPIVVLGALAGRALLDGPGFSAARLGLVLLSAGGLLGFVLVNASPVAGLRRFEVLMSETAPISPHERAYGSEKLANYFAMKGNRTMALTYAERALDADSANGRYWGKVGEALYHLGRYREAIPYFEQAMMRGTLRGSASYYIAFCHMNEGDAAQAVRYLREAVRVEPGVPRYWGALGLALINSGDLAGGRAVWEHTLRRWPADQETRTAYQAVFGSDAEPGRP